MVVVVAPVMEVDLGGTIEESRLIHADMTMIIIEEAGIRGNPGMLARAGTEETGMIEETDMTGEVSLVVSLPSFVLEVLSCLNGGWFQFQAIEVEKNYTEWRHESSPLLKRQNRRKKLLRAQREDCS
jgi:hypothetical protein